MPPRGWEPVAAAVALVWRDRESVTDRVAQRVRADIPAYQDAVTLDDLQSSVVSLLTPILAGVVERRHPEPHDLDLGRSLGRRRADQALPATAVVRGVRLGCRELWEELCRVVPETDVRARVLLANAAPVFWGWVAAVTDAVSLAHERHTLARQYQLAGTRQRFIERLAVASGDDSELPRLAAELGFDPEGMFRGVVMELVAQDGRQGSDLQTALDVVHGRHAVAIRGRLLVVASQQANLADVGSAIAGADFLAATGIGSERRGLNGLLDSLTDAELALALADSGQVVSFDAHWVWATLTRAAPRLQGLLQPGWGVAQRNTHLAETVTTFAASGFSLTEAARRLDIHPNTAAYRLDRWTALTGHDARTFDGLMASMAAIRLGGGAEARSTRTSGPTRD